MTNLSVEQLFLFGIVGFLICAGIAMIILAVRETDRATQQSTLMKRATQCATDKWQVLRLIGEINRFVVVGEIVMGMVNSFLWRLVKLFPKKLISYTQKANLIF